MTKNFKHFNKLDFVAEEGRQDIYHWYERRQQKYKGFHKSLRVFRIFAFNGQVLRSFVENFNFMVFLQMSLAALVTFLCKHFDIVYDVHVSLFISPIVFPLAFSINTDFQRKEKVLDDLALFKSSAMMWIFCMRDWREACSFDDHYMKALRNKIKGLMFHLREYLFTEKLDRRKFIVRVIYEDLSDTNQINEKLRCSQMNSNAPLVSRVVHFLNMMCLAFERLRVIREYRSPRSIRSFTKVLIFGLPVLLGPYYVYLGGRLKNDWAPYYVSTMVAFVFGALQGVQDKLDDPFDGMSEDDIKLDTLDEWTFQSLEATVHRTYKIGRFQVSSNPSESRNATNLDQVDYGIRRYSNKAHSGVHRENNIYRRLQKQHLNGVIGGLTHKRTPIVSPRRSVFDGDVNEDIEDFEFHPYAGVLHNIKGNTTILRGGQIKRNNYKSSDDLSSHNSTATRDAGASKGSFGNDISSCKDVEGSSSNDSHSVFSKETTTKTKNNKNTTPRLEFSESDVPLSGVMSYLLNTRLQQEAGFSQQRSKSLRSISSAHSLAEKSPNSVRSQSPQMRQKEDTTSDFYISEPVNAIAPSSTPRQKPHVDSSPSTLSQQYLDKDGNSNLALNRSQTPSETLPSTANHQSISISPPVNDRQTVMLDQSGTLPSPTTHQYPKSRSPSNNDKENVVELERNSNRFHVNHQQNHQTSRQQTIEEYPFLPSENESEVNDDCSPEIPLCSLELERKRTKASSLNLGGKMSGLFLKNDFNDCTI